MACLYSPHGVSTGVITLEQKLELSLAATICGAKVYGPILDKAEIPLYSD